MSETTWQRVASLAQLEPDYPTCVKVGSRELALYLIDGAVFATDNVCTHAYGRLSDGHVEGFQVYCPLHNGSFDVRTGEPINEPVELPVEVFECRVEGDAVLVKIAADE